MKNSSGRVFGYIAICIVSQDVCPNMYSYQYTHLEVAVS